MAEKPPTNSGHNRRTFLKTAGENESPVQRNEKEVRRNHHAGLPGLHQEDVLGRDQDGLVFRAVWRPHGQQHVRSGFSGIQRKNLPFCEASPDFCNWEHEYLLLNGLQTLAPYAHTSVHAKYWNRWKNPDVQRNVRIMKEAKYQGVYALEYEDGPWDGVEGAKYLYREVLAAL